MNGTNYHPLCTDPSRPWLEPMSPFSMTGALGRTAEGREGASLSLGSTAEGREGASLSQPAGGRSAWQLEPRDRRAALLYCTCREETVEQARQHWSKY